MTVKYEKFLLNGVEYKTQLTQKWVNRKKWEEPNPYLLTSHIPGTIMQRGPGSPGRRCSSDSSGYEDE